MLPYLTGLGKREEEKEEHVLFTSAENELTKRKKQSTPEDGGHDFSLLHSSMRQAKKKRKPRLCHLQHREGKKRR